MKFWKKPEVQKTGSQGHWRKDNKKAINVELSAYGLLALATVDNRADGLSVLKWLISQRNPNGGYTSTQVYI